MGKVLFETSYIGSLYGFFHIILALCGFCLIIFYDKKVIKSSAKINKRIARIDTKIILIILAIYIIVLVKGYVNVVIQYKTGNYIEVEGVVQNLHLNYRGTREYFTLDGVLFETSNISSWGYCQTRKNGGVIAGNGQHLRIRYIRNGNEKVIVYIEQMIPEEND